MARSDRLYQVLMVVIFVIFYFCLVFETFIKPFNKLAYQIIFLVMVHMLIFLIIWSYFATIFTEPGLPPEFWVKWSFCCGGWGVGLIVSCFGSSSIRDSLICVSGVVLDELREYICKRVYEY